MMPPIGYFGAKTRIAGRIADALPDHRHYVEPFAGSLTVLLAKQPSRMETVNDLDGDLMTFWRVLRDRPADLEAVCALTPHSRAEHPAAYQPAASELERARRVWVLLTQGRARTMRATGWRHHADPTGSTTSMPGYLRGYVARIAPAAARLAAVSLECRPALEVIAAYGKHPGVLIYADPPYPAATRLNSTGTYRHELTGDDDHAELAEALHACRSAVVISGYACPLYQQLYDGWHRHEIRAYSGYGTATKNRTEILWSNRPLDTSPQLFGQEIPA